MVGHNQVYRSTLLHPWRGGHLGQDGSRGQSVSRNKPPVPCFWELTSEVQNPCDQAGLDIQTGGTRELPGGPVVRTLVLSLSRARVRSLAGELSHVAQPKHKTNRWDCSSLTAPFCPHGGGRLIPQWPTHVEGPVMTKVLQMHCCEPSWPSATELRNPTCRPKPDAPCPHSLISLNPQLHQDLKP